MRLSAPMASAVVLFQVLIFGCGSGGSSPPQQPGTTPTATPAPTPTVTVTPEPSPSPTVEGRDLSGAWVSNDVLVCGGATVFIFGVTDVLTIDGNDYTEDVNVGTCSAHREGRIVFGENGTLTGDATQTVAGGRCTASFPYQVNGRQGTQSITFVDQPLHGQGRYSLDTQGNLIATFVEYTIGGTEVCSSLYARQ